MRKMNTYFKWSEKKLKIFESKMTKILKDKYVIDYNVLYSNEPVIVIYPKKTMTIKDEQEMFKVMSKVWAAMPKTVYLFDMDYPTYRELSNDNMFKFKPGKLL